MLRTNNTLPYGGATHNAYCVAMFVRACEGDAVARTWIERRFRMTVLNWIRRHPCREVACVYHPEAYYVARTFEHFWQTTQKLLVQCTELPALLRCMHACVNAAIVEALRISVAEPLPSQRMSESSRVQENSDKIWKRLQYTLHDPREQRLAYLLYACDLKPIEIVRGFPQEFGDVAEISSLRRVVFERLQQDV